MSDNRPIIFVVECDDDALAVVQDALVRRFGADYRVIGECAPQAALAALRRLSDEGEDVAVALAGQWLQGIDGIRLMEEIGELHPLAKRALLIDWGEWAHRPTAEAIFEGMANDHLDYYLVRPVEPPDEHFHRLIGEFLYEWSRGRSQAALEVTLVAEQWSPRAHEIRELLARTGVPHRFERSDGPEGRPASQRGRPVGRQVAGRNHARRARADRPLQPRVDRGLRGRHHTRRQPPRLRRRDRGRRTRRAYRGRVRVVRGTQHPGSRSRGSRWSGQRQLLDPKLPRVLAGDLGW